MEEMRVYIANLGKYNGGEFVGNWFTPPVDYDEMVERIGLNDYYEEYAISYYDQPFEIDEYTPIEEVNHLCAMVEELDYPINEVIGYLMSQFSILEELYKYRTTLSIILTMKTWWTLTITSLMSVILWGKSLTD